MTSKKAAIIGLLLAESLCLQSIQGKVLAASANPPLLITEVKLGGAGDPPEYIEIFNAGTQAIDLTGIKIEYAKSSLNHLPCQAPDWKAAAISSSQINVKTLSGQLEPHNFMTVAISLNDNTHGSARIMALVQGVLTQTDLVGWGSNAPCFVGAQAAIPLSGQVIKRTFAADGLPFPSRGDNGLDFTAFAEPSPGWDQCLATDCYPAAPVQTHDYPGLLITEMLPDPGSPKVDAADEYIELHNPSATAVNTGDYRLFVESETGQQVYILPEHSITGGGYLVLYAAETGLKLVNDKASYAWLADPDGNRLDESPAYPPAIKTDEAWARFEQNWQLTNILTPGETNKLPQLFDDEGIPAVSLGSCPEGKFRNPDTNRCKALTAAETILVPCSPGQVRSAETNRCRNSTSSKASLTACKPGQERNPETNRCRSVLAVTSSLTPCRYGYERNPETNRCRKADAITKSTSTRHQEKEDDSPFNLLLIIGVAAAAAGYAGYEYRRDLTNLFSRIFRRHIISDEPRSKEL